MIICNKDISFRTFSYWLSTKLTEKNKSRCRKFLERYRRFTAFINFNMLFPMLLEDDEDTIEDLSVFEQRVFSQTKGDGIIRIIFDKIGVTNKFFVEFGVQSGIECNSRYLRDIKKWNGLTMDCGDNLLPSTKKEMINAENVEKLFKKYDVPKEFDMLSIDIDSNEYWVWKAIKNYSPRLVIIEYNATFKPTESKVMKYIPNQVWDGTWNFGASLLALKKLGVEKGYTLIYCDSQGEDAFFLRNDLLKNHFKIKTIEELYRPSQRGAIVDGKYVGYPKSDAKMVKI